MVRKRNELEKRLSQTKTIPTLLSGKCYESKRLKVYLPESKATIVFSMQQMWGQRREEQIQNYNSCQKDLTDAAKEAPKHINDSRGLITTAIRKQADI